MKRKDFIKGIFGTSIFIAMDGFSSIAHAFTNTNQENSGSTRFATFGAIHLNNTSLEKSTYFWTKIVGMKLLKKSGNVAEFGTATHTLVVVHQSAETVFQKGFSGLYHLAIHAPNAEEFASMINRLEKNNYPYSPVDHTMSKSVYLDDPDGINVEFALETPERFKRVITQNGLRIEGSDGVIRSASDYLNVDEVLKQLVNNDINKVISNDTTIGHVHLYANNVEKSNAFYRKIGFLQFNYLPQFMYADVGAGGPYHHRIAMNSWHGMNRPLAPKNSAGMRHFQIIFSTKEMLNKALSSVPNYEEQDDGYWYSDPTGNKVCLTSA